MSNKAWNALVFLRILIGLFFVLVGGGKLIGPYQNFLFVVQTYELFPESLALWEEGVARIVPWVEFLAGIFLILGLWLKRVLQVFFVLIAGFLIVVGQAMVRKLPIEECGCFGEWLSVPLHGIFLFDSILLIAVGVMLVRLKRTSCLSLDNYFFVSIGNCPDKSGPIQ